MSVCKPTKQATHTHSHILTKTQVRVVDKHVRGGRLYLKKGTVIDVHPGARCDVSMDEGNDVVQVIVCRVFAVGIVQCSERARL